MDLHEIWTMKTNKKSIKEIIWTTLFAILVLGYSAVIYIQHQALMTLLTELNK